jgi:poly(3-hydroxybutyrate) depolymerase
MITLTLNDFMARFRLRIYLVLSSFVAALALVLPTHAQPYGSAGVQTAVPKTQVTTATKPSDVYGYYEYLPADYDHASPRKFGLMIFWHGAGEQGNGGSQLASVASGQWPAGFIANSGRTYPLIVLSPQCSNTAGNGNCGWWDQSRIVQFIALAKARYNVDPKRIYATGLSMGGAGTVFSARGATADIAAIVSICQAQGGSATDSALVNMPMWLAHAYNDTVVNWGQSWSFLNNVTAETADVRSGFSEPPTEDRTMLYDINTQTHSWTTSATSTNVDHNIRQRFTVYQSGGHGIWNRVYNDNNIMNWLYKQRLNETPQTCNLDVNAGGAFDLKDARVTIAWMFGFRGATLELFSGFNGTNAAAVDAFLTAQRNAGALDLDGDGAVDAMTDGLMLLRIALGFNDGAAISSNAINASGSRGTWAGVRSHLANNCKLNSLAP